MTVIRFFLFSHFYHNNKELVNVSTEKGKKKKRAGLCFVIIGLCCANTSRLFTRNFLPTTPPHSVFAAR